MGKLALGLILALGWVGGAWAHAYATCTLLGGFLVCMPTPDLHPESGSGHCYAAQMQDVRAQEYAAAYATIDAERAGEAMHDAQEAIYRNCGW